MASIEARARGMSLKSLPGAVFVLLAEAIDPKGVLDDGVTQIVGRLRGRCPAHDLLSSKIPNVSGVCGTPPSLRAERRR